jgi:hypothetical protein
MLLSVTIEINAKCRFMWHTNSFYDDLAGKNVNYLMICLGFLELRVKTPLLLNRTSAEH